MLFYCLVSVAESDTALNQQRSQNPEIENSNQSCNKNNLTIFKIVANNTQNVVHLLEKSQFPISYIWA